MRWLWLAVCCLGLLACAEAHPQSPGPTADASTPDQSVFIPIDAAPDARPPDASPPDASPPDASPPDAAPAAACAAAVTTQQTFNPFMTGCAGSVTWPNRATLCAAGRVACAASTWVAGHGAMAPAHDYWTSDDLRYTGGSTSCFVSTTVGNTCTGSSPMRVCSGTAADGEGNVCNWAHCGWQAATPDEYFGGCLGNTNAGTLCCLSACADGSIEDAFGGGMAGCAGSVAFSARATLCASGYHVCTASEWVAKHGSQVPTHNYWTNEDLRWSGNATGDCAVSSTVGNVCANSSPMRVCSGNNDAEGNTCNWIHCGYNTSTPDQLFGGCTGDPTAGALCCAP